jgi:hypothetical protein
MDYTPILMPFIKFMGGALLVVTLIQLLFVVLKRALFPKKKSVASRLPFKAQDSLLTPPELDFARGVIPYLPSHLHLCPKVSLKDVIHHGPNGMKNGNFGRISQKHLDFVIIESQTGRIRLAIEIDDRSHQRADRQKSDQVKNEALAKAGIPLLRIRPRQSVAIEDILQAIAA